MARFLLLCCICLLAFSGIRAQERSSRDTMPQPAPFVAQKLNLKPTGTPPLLGEATKLPDSSAKSILYLGSRSKDTLNLDLPKMKNKNIDFRFQAGKNQALYWENLHY